jgi:RNA polymerase sigma-70 factor (ECF subfamily)
MRPSLQMDNESTISTAQARQLSVLWTRAHPIVSAYLRSCLFDFHQAEDLLQETAAAAAEKFATYDATRPFTAWVLGIARNKLLLHYRTHAAKPHIFDDAAVRDIAEAYADMEPEISAMHDALEVCLDRVQGRARKLLELRYTRDLTPARIAATTGMNANAVSVMLFRIRQSLKECIERRLQAMRDGNHLANGI